MPKQLYTEGDVRALLQLLAVFEDEAAVRWPMHAGEAQAAADALRQHASSPALGSYLAEASAAKTIGRADKDQEIPTSAVPLLPKHQLLELEARFPCLLLSPADFRELLRSLTDCSKLKSDAP